MARNIFQTAIEMLDGGENAAMVTIVSAEGFVPVAATSKLLVTSTGTLLGRSDSDILDADIHAEAQRVLAQGPHSSRQFCVLDKDAVVNGWYRAWTVELPWVERREKCDAPLFELLDRKGWEGRVERMARGAARSRGADGLLTEGVQLSV